MSLKKSLSDPDRRIVATWNEYAVDSVAFGLTVHLLSAFVHLSTRKPNRLPKSDEISLLKQKTDNSVTA